jgi:hypothetical protein
MLVNYKVYRILCSIYKIIDTSIFVNKSTKLKYQLTYSIISIILKNKNIIDIKTLKNNLKNNLITFNFKIF